MAIKLTVSSRHNLTNFIDALLIWTVRGEVSVKEAGQILTQLVTSAASGKAVELNSFINKPGTLADFRALMLIYPR